MAVISNGHQLASANAEALSTTDTTQYQSVLVINRRIRSGSTEQGIVTIGGSAVLNGQFGYELAAGAGYLFPSSSGVLYRLTEIFGIGTNGDWIDYKCVRTP